jgi:hypothetical protein
MSAVKRSQLRQRDAPRLTGARAGSSFWGGTANRPVPGSRRWRGSVAPSLTRLSPGTVAMFRLAGLFAFRSALI